MRSPYLAILVCLALLACLAPLARAASLAPETNTAFERYLQAAEAAMDQRSGARFLSFEQDPKQKTIIWLGQTVIEPKSVDPPIDVPGGLVQDFIGTLYLEGATLERVRDMILNFADYKVFFRQQIIESRLARRDRDRFEGMLRLYKRQVTPIVLNTQFTAVFKSIDAQHAAIAIRSTHIGEAAHPGKKKTYDQERPDDDREGYLWRLNLYWRLARADNGVYAELELISLARPSSGLHTGRYLTGYENFPRELEEAILDEMKRAFPLMH